jgi:hypothetical protein
MQSRRHYASVAERMLIKGSLWLGLSLDNTLDRGAQRGDRDKVNEWPTWNFNWASGSGATSSRASDPVAKLVQDGEPLSKPRCEERNGTRMYWQVTGRYRLPPAGECGMQ